MPYKEVTQRKGNQGLTFGDIRVVVMCIPPVLAEAPPSTCRAKKNLIEQNSETTENQHHMTSPPSKG